MRSCEPPLFVPLVAGPRADFRPLGTPAPPVVAEPPGPGPDAHTLAYETGRVQGRAEADAEHALLACELESMLAAVHAWRAELRIRYTPMLVSLAVEIARKIVGAELEARPERWIPIMAGAIRRLVDRERVTVRVSPRLAALVRAHAPALGVEGEVRVVEDATLAPDACRIEGEAADVECGIGAQIAAVAEALGASGG